VTDVVQLLLLLLGTAALRVISDITAAGGMQRSTQLVR